MIVAEAVWQFSHHVLAGLRDHQGSILTVANWSGEWPGLVGLLNLGGGLTKMGVTFSSLWSKDFNDDFFMAGLTQFLETGTVKHDLSHVRELEVSKLPQLERELGTALAQQLKLEKAILGVFRQGPFEHHTNGALGDELEMMNAGIFRCINRS